jgi:ElaB/YqjD/DUF883 family membrane-anchored ribosome-binding protein
MRTNTTNESNPLETHRLDDIKDSIKGLVDRGHDKVNAIKDKAVDVQHRARERGSAAIDRTTTLIKDHPIAAVGIAFGVGYLIMRLVRR